MLGRRFWKLEMKIQGKGIFKPTKRKRERLYGAFMKAQEQFGRKINQDVNGNRKLLWKEVSKANGGKVKNSNSIKDGNGKRLKYEGFRRHIMRIYII